MNRSESQEKNFGRNLLRIGLVTAGALAVWGLAGCADKAVRPVSGAPAPALPWWVASPSAPLPHGFPAPGPLGDVVIKQYPAYRAAVARGDGSSSDGSLFFPLFNHIEQRNIAMSSPVALTYDAAAPKGGSEPARSMAFIYGDAETGKPGTDGPVDVVSFPPGLFASLGVTGSYTQEHYQVTLKKLRAWLEEHHGDYSIAGEPRYLAYNSPFVLPFMRYGEVQIPVQRTVH